MDMTRAVKAVKFEEFVQARAQERSEINRRWRTAVDGRRAIVRRKLEVQRFLAGKNLAPRDRAMYERELRGLQVELRHADRFLDSLRNERCA